MPWSKLSDDFSDDLWAFSDRAFRLHVEAIVWSGRKLLDMRIPAIDLRRFARNAETVEHDAAELVEAGYWERDGDMFVIVHHSKYQRTREAVINQQAANKANRAKAGKAPKSSRETLPHASFDEGFDDSSQERVGFGSVGYGSRQEQPPTDAHAREDELPPLDAPTGGVDLGEHVGSGTDELRGWPFRQPGAARSDELPPDDPRADDEPLGGPPFGSSVFEGGLSYAGEGLRGAA